MKRISKILCSIILIMMLVIQVMPITVEASSYSDVKDAINTIQTLGYDIGPNGDKLTERYQILSDASESSGLSKFSFAIALLDEMEFKNFKEGMTSLLSIATTRGDPLGDGAVGQKIANSEKKSDRKKYLTAAHLAMQKLFFDISSMAEIRNYIVTEYRIDFFGLSKLTDDWDDGVLKELTNDAIEAIETKKGVNKEQLKRIAIYGKALMETCGVDRFGDVMIYAKSAELTYEAALAELEKSSTFHSGDKSKFDIDSLKKYYRKYGYNYSSNDNISGLESTLKVRLTAEGELQGSETVKDWARKQIEGVIDKESIYTADEISEMWEDEAQPRNDKDKYTNFQLPKNVTAVAKSDDEDENGPSDVVRDAEAFLDNINNEGEEYVTTENLQKFSQDLYSILFGLGIIVAVIVGVIIGIRLMLAPVEQRAEANKLLLPYIVGCIIVFGAFGIWQLAITIMQQI
ncbi:MAG: hypothetical protein IKF38_07440 [Clostridia bacterium]|nr:hypothetical protein [Clostridia bacterium]